MIVGPLESGTKGFDCDARVNERAAAKLVRAGFEFAMRYVRARRVNAYDLQPNELATLLRAGLSVGIVQHVLPPGWHPSESLGRELGATAAEEAGNAGVLPGVTVWCDLEEVASSSSSEDVIAYVNAWTDAVRAGGFDPGLYVGYGAKLTPRELYFRLRVRRYWSAYNLSRLDEPAVRGVQMRQFEIPDDERPRALGFDIDGNRIRVDAFGDVPTFLLASALE